MQLPDVPSCCSEVLSRNAEQHQGCKFVLSVICANSLVVYLQFTSQEGQQHFLQLPADALFVIVSGLDSAGLASLQSTCHQLRRVVHVNG